MTVFMQVSKEIFDSAQAFDDVKNNYIVSTSRVILDDKKGVITFCNERDDMKGFIKKEKSSYFLNFGSKKRIYPKSLKSDEVKIIDGRYITYRDI